MAVPQEALLERWREEVATGATRVGWKIGHDIPEITAHIGDRPVIGYLTSRTIVENRGKWSRRGSDLRAETEYAVSVGAKIDAAADLSDVQVAIAGLCVALEIVELDRPAGDLAAVMHGNVFHRAVAFRPTRAPSPNNLGRATLRLDDTVHAASEAMPDPVWVVRRAADVLDQFGERLLPGDRILSGSFVHRRLGLARCAAAEIRGLGQVSLAIG